MYEKMSKWGAGIAGLCLLCCALPLTFAFLGGGGVAAAALIAGDPGVLREIGILAGVLVMALAAWAILRRHRRNCNSCDVR